VVSAGPVEADLEGLHDAVLPVHGVGGPQEGPRGLLPEHRPAPRGVLGGAGPKGTPGIIPVVKICHV